MELKDILTLIQTGIIGAVGLYIARKQWQIGQRQARTAQRKLKLDLFDRRAAVYEAASRYLGKFQGRGEVTPEDDLDFLIAIEPTRWLFSLEIDTFLRKQVWEQVAQASAYRKMTKGDIGPSEERTAMINKERDIRIALLRTRDEIVDVFSPYLQLGH